MAGCGTQDAGRCQDHPRSGTDGAAELLQRIREVVGAIPPPAVGSRGHSLPGTLHTSVCLCVCVCFPSSPSLLWGFSVLHLVLSVMASTRNILFSVAFQRMCKYSMRHYIFPL